MAIGKRKKKMVIGDGGMFEKPDMSSMIITIICTIVVILLVFLGAMAYIKI